MTKAEALRRLNGFLEDAREYDNQARALGKKDMDNYHWGRIVAYNAAISILEQLDD